MDQMLPASEIATESDRPSPDKIQRMALSLQKSMLAVVAKEQATVAEVLSVYFTLALQAVIAAKEVGGMRGPEARAACERLMLECAEPGVQQ